MSRKSKLFGLVLMSSVLILATVSPAHAFDGRGGNKVVIAAGETVNDDLYVGANEFVLDGTVNGDVIAGGQMITINGTINGNLIAVGQSIVINGEVSGDVLAGGSVLFFGGNCKVGGDVIGAGGSLELRKGSTVGRDAVMAAGQTLLGADVARNVKAASGALEIAGTIGGDVQALVGEANQSQQGLPPGVFMPQSTIPVPSLRQGLTLDPAAKILGNLEYSQNTDLTFPSGVVQGKVTRIAQPQDERQPAPQQTVGAKIGMWALGVVRSIVTLILLGLLLIWALPRIVAGLSAQLQARPWPSLGWGVVAYAAFFFLILLALFSMIIGAVISGVLTLGGLSGAFVAVGILSIFALIVAFVLVTSFVAKIVFGMSLGKWILVKAKSPLSEHKFWPMAIGVTVTVIVIALLSFPLMPGFLGWLLNFAVVLFGLGALWLWVSEGLRKRPGATV